MGDFSPFHLLVLIICGLLYFIPAIVGRKKRNSSAIFWLNFLLGWTAVGWIGTLVLAVKKDPLSAQVIENDPVPEWVRCPSCGTYLSPGTKFCTTCGSQITTDSP